MKPTQDIEKAIRTATVALRDGKADTFLRAARYAARRLGVRVQDDAALTMGILRGALGFVRDQNAEERRILYGR